MKRIYSPILLVLLFILACNSNNQKDNKKATLFKLLTADQCGINFTNKIHNEKDFNIFRYRNFYNGGGVGIGDINNDSLPDIYFTSNMEENRLFLNEGGFKFRDITSESGTAGTHSWSTGVVMVDINADGLLDIYVCNAGNVEGDDRENELFINNGDNTFTERAEDFGLADNGFTTHVAFFDYDKDEDLDVYILNNSFIPVNSLGYSNKRELRSKDWDMPEIVKGGGDKLLRNDDGKFVDVSEEAGIYGSLIGFGLGVTVGDINHDQLPDIYVSNDFYERDYLYINNGNGTFTESIKTWVAHLSIASMGADMADINNDGYSEIYVTDMLPEEDARLKNTSNFESYDIYNLKQNRDFYHQYMQNSLQLNNGNETFSEIAFHSGVAQTDWSWGPIMFDMDNDGLTDIFVSNGIYHELTNQDFIDFFANVIVQEMTVHGRKEEIDSVINKMPSNPIPNYAFKNNGDLTFTNMSSEWGFDKPSFSNGSAYGDLDNDGDLDLVINNVNQPCFVYKNLSSENIGNRYLKVKLKGRKPNTFGIGSVAFVYINSEIHKRELISSRGFQSSVSHIMNFGIGKADKVDSVLVVWPDGKSEIRRDIAANQLLTFNKDDAEYNILRLKRNLDGSVSSLIEENSPFEAHQENHYVDFDYEGLISEMLSREGPAIDVADLNKDGLDDVYMGGATGYAGQIYIQSPGSKMKAFMNDCFNEDKKFEDTFAKFFDADGDGDQDLYVGSGGNDKDDESVYLRDRLYLNNGKGKFEKSEKAIPDFRYNTSVAATYDFDQDGDLDIFVGSLSVSKIYGINPKHYLLENDGTGNFKDITESRAFKFKDLGMVTDAEWQDMDGDGLKDLVVVGQWMSPVIFKNTGRNLNPIKTSLDDFSGWWNAVSVADLDNDGDMDLVLGNRGNNSYIKVSSEAPAKMFVNDFDNNGTIEQICTRYVEGKDKPIPLKREITNQLPSLRKKNLKFSEYAEKSIYDLFSEELIKNSLFKEVTTSLSLIAYNEGNNNFRIVALPKDVQFTCVNEILVTDINGDKYPDLLLGENNHSLKPQYGRFDAGFVHLIKGNKEGILVPERISARERGVVNTIKKIDYNGQQHIILGINNEKSKIYKINR